MDIDVYLEQVYSDCREELVRYLVSRDVQLADAQDIVQNVFAQFVVRVKHLGVEHVKNVKAYLKKMLRDEVILYYRGIQKKKREIPFEEDLETLEQLEQEGQVFLMEETLFRQGMTEKLRQAINGLDPEKRELLQLKIVEGYSFWRIAAAMDMPKANVQSRYYRVLKALKQAMEDEL